MGLGSVGLILTAFGRFRGGLGIPTFLLCPLQGCAHKLGGDLGGLHPTAGTTENSQTEGTCLGNIHLPLSGCLDFEKTFYIYHELQFF